MSNQDSWSNYWQTNNKSIVNAAERFPELEAFWTEAFANLRENSQLLEIGAGNGALIEKLKQQPNKVDVTCIDSASIDVENEIFESNAQVGVQYFQQQKIETFETEKRFDLIYSQFAVEYSTIELAIAAMEKLAAINGCVSLVCHEAGSAIYNATKTELDEIDWLEVTIDLFATVYRQIELKHKRLTGASPSDYSAFRQHDRQYKDLIKKLRTYFKESESGFFGPNLISVIEHSIDSMDHFELAEVNAKIQELETNMAMHKQRLSLLIDAALDAEKLEQMVTQLSSSFEIKDNNLIYRASDGQILARKIIARKK